MNKITANFAGQTIYIGMDVHKDSWNLGIHLNDIFMKNVHQKPNPTIMADYLKKNYPNAHYKAAYEAGKFGFWIQRQLTGLGIECLVVNPADIPKSQKDTLQKTDSVMRVILACDYNRAYCEVSIFLMNSRKQTAYFSGIAKRSGKICVVVKTALKDAWPSVVLTYRNSMIMPVAALTLSNG